jgi:HAD superfamily hydrolase (TIGR01450 family)
VLLLVDLDGVVYRGPEPVPGMPELLTRRVAKGDRVIYVTNNSRWHRSEYQARLASMGAPLAPDGNGVVTSARATALAVAEFDPPPRLTMVLGGPGLVRELREVGLRTVPPTAAGLAANPDALVVGVDFAFSHRRLSAAANAVLRGARFVATNRDPIYPTDVGLLAGAGAMVAAVAASAMKEPDLVVGKPEPKLFLEAAALAGVAPSEAIVVGDGLLTDIKAAHAIGARSVLMLTGVSTLEDVEMTDPNLRPTAIAHDADELDRVLERLERSERKGP